MGADETLSSKPKICVVGLGYVGLPLAVALARHFDVIGFDTDAARVSEIRAGHDRTHEVDGAALRNSSLSLSTCEADLCDRNLFIVAVPTPVTADHQPDLDAVDAAMRTVGRMLRAGGVVVLESTVYPGVTENICGPVLEAVSGLISGRDFFLGYSPERINPGDGVHTLERVVKIVAGQTPEVGDFLASVYGKVTKAGVFRATSIKAAEAAKVIENAQRDINIAFVNEVTQIFHRMGLSIFDVLAAARTKWNFLDFRPGLVGGHCIGVDPYYLAHCSEQLGFHPQVILSGRRTNDLMGEYFAERAISLMRSADGSDYGRCYNFLVLGLTYKENVPDLRNSKVVDLIATLAAAGHRVSAHDPVADLTDADQLCGARLISTLDTAADYDCVIGAVAHDCYRALKSQDFGRLLRDGGIAFDLRNMWTGLVLPESRRRLSI